MPRAKTITYPCVLTVTANPSLDVVLEFHSSEENLSFSVEKSHAMAGGKGINVGRTLDYFKVPVLMTGFIGGRIGAKMKSFLDQERLCHDFVNIPKATRINYFLYYKKELIHAINNKGPVILKNKEEEFLKKWAILSQKVAFVVISGSLAPGLENSFYARLLRDAKRRKIFTVLDSHGPAFRLGLKERPLLIKPNKEEAEEFLGYALDTDEKIIKALKDFRKLGIAHVVISLGEKGAAASDGKRIWLSEKVHLRGRYPTGSGDSMVGGIVYGLYNGFPFEKAWKVGIAAGIANAFTIMPGEFKGEMFEKVLKTIKIKRID